MFFFDDNVYNLRKGDPSIKHLCKIAIAKNILLMGCDQCALRRDIAEGEFSQFGSGEVTPKEFIDLAFVGCFPQFLRSIGASRHGSSYYSLG